MDGDFSKEVAMQALQSESPLPKLYTYNETAEFLGIHPVTLRAWVAKRRVPHRRIGGKIRFTTEDLNSIVLAVPAKGGTA